MSLISPSSSAPALWIVFANSICLAVRFPSTLSPSSFARISSELSGVRSSCDMFARNSDLYFDESASCSAFSSSALRASSISAFLISIRRFCSSSCCERSSSSSFVCCSSSCWVCSSSSEARKVDVCASSSAFERFSSSCCDCSSSDWLCRSCVSCCDWSSSSSVRMFAVIVFRTTPIDSESCSRNVCWISVNGVERGELDHGHHRLLEEDGDDDDARRGRLAEAGCDLDVVLGSLRDHDRLPLERGLPDQRLADLEAVRDRLSLLVAVRGDQAQLGLLVLAGVLGDVEGAVVGLDERRHLAHQEPGDRLLVALALQHPGEAGEVRVEPVLRGIALRRLAQVADHLVDVVLEVRDLAGGLDGDRSGQVALGHGGGDIRDRAELGRQRLGELVHVVGQALPHARDALDLRLHAELPLGADLLRDAGHLRREGGELVDHRVDRPVRAGRPRPSPRR